MGRFNKRQKQNRKLFSELLIDYLKQLNRSMLHKVHKREFNQKWTVQRSNFIRLLQNGKSLLSRLKQLKPRTRWHRLIIRAIIKSSLSKTKQFIMRKTFMRDFWLLMILRDIWRGMNKISAKIGWCQRGLCRVSHG